MQDKLVTDWRLYKISANYSAADLSASPIAKRLNVASLLLVLNLAPAQDHYLYAPFAPDSKNLTPEKRAEIEGLYLPLHATVLGTRKQPLPELPVFYPPGALKYDSFANAELPVYQAAVDILVPLPASYLQQTLFINIDALLCSAISCTPVKTQIEFTPADLSANSELLPDKLQKTLADYQIAPLAGQKAIPATSPGISPADYSKTFAPQFFHAGLEVYGLAQAILLGFLAGFILNFMPCVLPVVSLKLGTLAGLGGLKSLSGQPGNNEQAKRIQGRLRTYSLFFSLGVFIWFAALFAVIGLAGMMWGQFFQSEKVLLAMVIILFLLALSLFGVFHLPLLHVAYENTDPKMESAGKPGYGSLPRQAFAGGLLATLMATPCSGPLLGGVLSWAVGEPLPFLALALASVGLGMSAPFLLLALKPGLARFFPQPGPWNIILEKITAFLLLGTVLYLLSILQESGLIRILCALLLLSVAAWIWGHKATSRPRRSVPGLLTAALFAGLALYSVFTGQKTEQDAQIYPQQYTGTAWQNYTPELFSSVLGQQNILLDFTADWCINCRVMEATTLSDANRAQWQAKYKLTYMKADLTRENKPAEALLRAVGSTSIPVIVIFPTGEQSGKPVVLRDISTVGQVEEALKQTLDELK